MPFTCVCQPRALSQLQRHSFGDALHTRVRVSAPHSAGSPSWPRHATPRSTSGCGAHLSLPRAAAPNAANAGACTYASAADISATAAAGTAPTLRRSIHSIVSHDSQPDPPLPDPTQGRRCGYQRLREERPLVADGRTVRDQSPDRISAGGDQYRRGENRPGGEGGGAHADRYDLDQRE